MDTGSPASNLLNEISRNSSGEPYLPRLSSSKLLPPFGTRSYP